MRRLTLALLVLFAGKSFATGEINVLTDLKSPFPPGCVALWLPEQPASGDNTLFDETVRAPSIGSQSKDARVRVTIWRVGCHDPGHSVVMVRLERVSGGDVLVPQVFAEPGLVDFPVYEAQLIRHPAVGSVGASSNLISSQGTTYMLALDQFTFTPEDYNDTFSLELFWGDFSPVAAPEGEWFPIAEYAPSLDPTQFAFPILHGRMSGQFVIDGVPSSGLALQIGEQVDDTNFLFALFFTYLDGEPIWITGNTAGREPGMDFVDLEMFYLTGGEFFTFGADTFDETDIDAEPIGFMSIEALDCNTLLLGYDFAEAGLGTGVVEAERLVRIAGYDCNPWD